MISHAALINGMRVVSITLAAAIILWWVKCWWAAVRGIDLEENGSRAVWVAFAWSAVQFNIRYLAPILPLKVLDTIQSTAHISLIFALLLAIYVEGAKRSNFNLRRAIIVHAVMLAAGIISAAAFAR